MTISPLKRAYLTAPDADGEIRSGVVYFSGNAPRAVFDENLHINRGSDGLWFLTIGNMQWESRDLAELESHLRDWAADEYPDFPAATDHASIEVEILARAFAAELLNTIGADNLATVIERNAATGQPCASHEFCDANMVMDAAWRAIGFAPMAFAEHGGPTDEQAARWDRAWDYAVANRFFTESRP